MQDEPIKPPRVYSSKPAAVAKRLYLANPENRARRNAYERRYQPLWRRRRGKRPAAGDKKPRPYDPSTYNPEARHLR
jgi:hypothetical protein